MNNFLSFFFKKFIQSSKENLKELQDRVEVLYKELPMQKLSKNLFTNVLEPKPLRNDHRETEKLSCHVYLYRSSKKKRVFQPPMSNLEAKWDDFISLGNDKDFFDKAKLHKRFFEVEDHYTPLKVKRIQGNPFRSKAAKVPKAKKTNKSWFS